MADVIRNNDAIDLRGSSFAVKIRIKYAFGYYGSVPERVSADRGYGKPR
jgi:hypothetical protein